MRSDYARAAQRRAQLPELMALIESGAAREVRLRNGLTLDDVAERVEVAESCVWNWENQIRTPSGRNIPVYLAVLRELQAPPHRPPPKSGS